MAERVLDQFVCVPISVKIYQAVLAKYGDRANGLIETVVEDYLERTAGDDLVLPESSDGIYWDSLFLTDGTRLRTKHHGHYQYAQVVGDKISFQGEFFPSVAKAANRMRNNVPSNAWKVVEVNRPHDSQWLHAESLRRKGGF